MAGLSNYLETKYLEHLVGIANLPTALSTVYIGLNSADDDTGGSEVTTTYLAGRVAYSTSGFSSPSTASGYRRISNSAAIPLGTAIAAATSIPYYSIWDAASGGNCLWVNPFVNSSNVPTPFDFDSGDNISILANTLYLELSIADFSIYIRDVQLNWIKGATAPSAVAPYIGLATAATADGAVTEVTSTVRVAGRIQVSGWDAVSASGDYQFTQNTAAINFGSSAGSVTGLDFAPAWDAASGGNLLIFPALPVARDISTGDPVVWDAGKYKVQQN